MLGEYLSFAWDSIMHRSTRSLLTVLGIMIGIGAIVALIAVGQGLQDTVTTQFEKIGSNRIIIAPGGEFYGPMGSGLVAEKLRESDLKAVQRVPGVEIARGILSRTATVKFAGKTRSVMVLGSPTDSQATDFIKTISFYDVETGRQLSGNYDIIIGNKLGSRIFNETINLGDRIDLNGYTFRVVGIQSKTGMGMYDMMVRIPLDTTRSIFNVSDEYSSIFASVREGYPVAKAAEGIKEALRKERGEKEREETFSVQTIEQVVTGLGAILGTVQIVFVGIAAISLIVGGVGIMNSMYTSVLERTRQIGIMKSVGARNSDILGMFVVEAGLLGMIGGILGVAGGAGLSFLFNWIAENMLNLTFRAVVSLELVAGALAFAFVIGMISGFFPAQRAAGMKPTEAMRI
jgi:putative ABC transport system permease protein